MILIFSISNNRHLLVRCLSFWFPSNSFNFALKITNSKNENENHYFKKSSYKKPYQQTLQYSL